MQINQRQSTPPERLLKILPLLFLLASLNAKAQTTYLAQGAKENILLERMEIKLRTDSVLNFSKNRPLSREQFIPALQRAARQVPLSKADAWNLFTAQAINNEYAVNRDSLVSKRTFWKKFYKTPANFFEVNEKDFHFAVNPVFQFTVGKESGYKERLFQNTRGVALRGSIANKVGFWAYLSENQERDPRFVQQWVAERKAVPGQGFYKDFKTTGFDYFDARGGISLKATRYIDVVFGYDRNFIGNGYRSLFLSDFSNNALFLKLNTRIWKFNYQNLFMELVNANRKPADVYLDKKYAAIHHLDLAITKWLNVGLFEAVVFGRPNRFEFGYLNPVIFYRSAEQQNGSFDNAIAGLDVKANVARRFQFYGQLLVDELRVHELKNSWWGNKFGFQVGGKYVDAFGISNLDLQGEWNRVRPFTYSHTDSTANYTHSNQPLAHPLGASFNEFIGLLRYQPLPRLMLQAKAIVYEQGRDTSAASFGSNIFLPVRFRPVSEYGYEIGSPASATTGYASLLVSYELRPNFFVEASLVRRTQGAFYRTAEQNTTAVNVGVRWNMHRREFDF